MVDGAPAPYLPPALLSTPRGVPVQYHACSGIPTNLSALALVHRSCVRHAATRRTWIPHCIIFAGTTERGSAGPSPCVCRAAAMCQVVIVAAGLKGLRLSGRRNLPRPRGVYAMYPVIFTRPTPRIRRCECVMRRQWTRACRNLSRAPPQGAAPHA